MIFKENKHPWFLQYIYPPGFVKLEDVNSKLIRSILQPGTAPGECWAFKGSHGSVVVKLSASIMVIYFFKEKLAPPLHYFWCIFCLFFFSRIIIGWWSNWVSVPVIYWLNSFLYGLGNCISINCLFVDWFTMKCHWSLIFDWLMVR